MFIVDLIVKALLAVSLVVPIPVVRLPSLAQAANASHATTINGTEGPITVQPQEIIER